MKEKAKGMSENATESQKWDSKLPRFIALLLNWGLWFDLVYTFIHLRLSRSFKSTSMAASMSSSCCLSSLRLIPFKRTFFSSVNPPSKNLILRPIPSFLRTIVTFQKIPTVIVPPLSASSSSPSSSVDLQPIEELPPKLQEIVKLFQSVQEPKAKYDQLLLRESSTFS